MMNCPKCHSELTESKSCQHCGDQYETTPLDPPEEVTAEPKPRHLNSKDLTSQAPATNVEPLADANVASAGRPRRRVALAAWLAAGVTALAVALAVIYAAGRQSANAQCGEKDTAIATLNSTVQKLDATNERLVATNEKLVTAVEQVSANNQKLNASNERAASTLERVTTLNETLNGNNQRLAATIEKISAANDKMSAANQTLTEEVAAGRRAYAGRESASGRSKSSSGRAGNGRAPDSQGARRDRPVRKRSDGGERPTVRSSRKTYVASNGSGGTGGRLYSRH